MCTKLVATVSAGLALFIFAVSPASAQCPAIGRDTGCGTVITISDAGVTVTSTGQGPYDGIEDTLVGVVNNSSQPLRALGLKSAQLIFGFDGDGIVSYGVPGNARDSTGYGGPNAYFTNIDSNLKVGVVNFIVPLAAHGGSTYFSLEEAVSNAHSCKEIVDKAVTTMGPFNQKITSTFTPNLGYDLRQAADACGFVQFDWQQRITAWPKPSALIQVGNPTALFAPPSFFDPPPGGYTYELTNGFPNGDHAYPFYYDPSTNELVSHETPFTLSFSDTPTNNCMPGGTGAACGGKTAPAGSVMAFTTHLVGVNSDRTATDLNIGFKWQSTFNGSSGGVVTTKNDLPVDPGSGTGGVTVLSVQDTTDYQYNGVTVTTVNGVSVDRPKIASITPSSDSLWPPNGKFVPVTLSVDATGGSGGDPICTIAGVKSNEFSQTPGGSEWLITDALTVSLRAQRSGAGSGRQYTITVTCTNNAGSASLDTIVTVPHDQGK